MLSLLIYYIKVFISYFLQNIFKSTFKTNITFVLDIMVYYNVFGELIYIECKTLGSDQWIKNGKCTA